MARLQLVSLLSVLCCAVAPAAAAAQAPQLTVDNVGQPALPISGATATVVAAGNTCAAPFTTAAAGCAAWPALGPRPWAPELPAAGGDSFALSFSAPVSAVSAAATSNFPLGLTTPDGTVVGNDVYLAPTAATATAGDATRWTITLPALTPRGSGGTFTVVATDADGPHGYALSLRTPRWLDEAAKCGPTAYSPAQQLYNCLGAGVKGPPPDPQEPGGGGTPPVESGPSDGGRGSVIGRRPRAPRAAAVRVAGGALRLRVTVATAGTLRIELRLPGRRGTRAVVLHPRAKGTVSARFTLPPALRHGRHAYALSLRLTTAAGTATRAQRIVAGTRR